jgi:hypothetical protein
MALTQRFRDMVLDSAAGIGDFEVNKPYPVLRAESVDTKYGPSSSDYSRERQPLCQGVSTVTLQSVLFRRRRCCS